MNLNKKDEVNDEDPIDDSIGDHVNQSEKLERNIRILNKIT